MKLNPKIYRKAVEHLDINTDFSCTAIKIAARFSSTPDTNLEDYVQAYEELFYPPNHVILRSKDLYLRGDAWGDLWGKKDTDRNNCRVLALLFMAEIAKG